MAEHRFSEFHCNILPRTKDDVIVVANEAPDGKTVQHVATSKGGMLNEASKEPVILQSDHPPISAGPVAADDRKTGQALVTACRRALGFPQQ